MEGNMHVSVTPRRQEAGNYLVEVSEFRVPTETRAAIFDFDGTLFNTWRAHVEPFKQAIEERFRVTLDRDEWKDLFLSTAGGAPLETARALLHKMSILINGRDHKPSDKDAEELNRRRLTLLQENIDQYDVTPVPGGIELLRAAHAHGLQVALCTSSDSEFVNLIAARFGITDLISQATFCSDVPRDQTKPSPYPYVVTAKKLQVDVGAVVAFEDSPRGALSSWSAGILTCVAFAPHLRQQHQPQLEAELSTASWPKEGPPVSVVQDWHKVRFGA